MPARAGQRCAHCGLDAEGPARQSDRRVFCCAGCEAVYGILHDEGLGRFYEAGGVGSRASRVRAPRPGEASAGFPVLDALEAAGEADLDVVGMRCASCAWLIERYLGRRPGVAEVRVSYATSTCRLRWDRDRTSLAHLLAELERIGYRARPSDPRLRAAQEDREGRALALRVGISAFLAMNVMLAAVALYAGDFQGIGAAVRHTLRVASAVLAAPVVGYGGWPFFRGAVAALRSRRASMDTLVAMGASTAFGLSLFGLATEGPVFFDTAAMIVVLILAGRMVEHAVRRRGVRAIRNLLALEPDLARVVTPDGSATVRAADLAAGQIVEVRPGERFPADGTVLEGRSGADESMLTGESAPREVQPGSDVAGGSLNTWGVLRFRAEHVGADTAVAGIVRAVQRALESRAPLQRLADRTMSWFVPAVAATAVLTSAAWVLAGAGVSRALLTGVAVVVIACPCALGLATPVALAVAVGEAAERGIFFSGAEALERAASVRQVVFDKTGTLTDGRLAVTALLPEEGWSAEELLALAGVAATGSEHALAHAVAGEARARNLVAPESRPESFRAFPGAGVEARVGRHHVLVGSADFVRTRGASVRDPGAAAGSATLACVVVDGRYAGAIAAGDGLRAEARGAVAALGRLGIETGLLSGDRRAPVRLAAAAVGIPSERARHGATPGQKASHVAALRANGPVAMVGDGVNDAPALAAADVGFALGTGADVTLETADVALRTADLRAVPAALDLARRARRVVRQNLGWAMGYNLLAVPLAAAGLLHPILAALAMGLSSLCVLANSLRLSRPF